MVGRQIVEFLHKRTRQIFSLLAFRELASGGFFQITVVNTRTSLFITDSSICFILLIGAVMV
jgi:hypothetical protein